MAKKSKKSKKSSERKRAKRKEEKRRESQRKEVRKLLKKQYRNLSLRELRSKRTTIARSDSNDARIPLIDRYIRRRNDEAVAQARDAKGRADMARLLSYYPPIKRGRRSSEKKSEAKFSLEDLYTPEQLALLLGTKQRKEPEKKGDSGREVKSNKKRKRAATPDWGDDFDDEFVPVRNEGDPLTERKRPPPPVDAPDEDEVVFTLNHGETLDEADEDELLKWNNNRVRVDVYYTDAVGEQVMHLTLTNSNNAAQQAVRRFLRGNWWSGPHMDRSGGVDSEELEVVLNLANITRIEFVRVTDPSRIPRSRAEVAKCPFELDSIFSELAEDLKEAQIYIKGSEIPRDAKQCMVHTFTYFGLPSKEVEAVLHKHTVKRLKNGWERSTSMKVEPALREIAAHFKKKIVFQCYKSSGTRYGKPRLKMTSRTIPVEDADDTPALHVGSFDNHVFPNNEIDATMLYLRQPEKCVEAMDFHQKLNGTPPPGRSRARDIYRLDNRRDFPKRVFKPKSIRILELLNKIDEKHKIPLKGDQNLINSAAPEMKVPPLTTVLDQKPVKRKERKQLFGKKKKTRSFYSIDIETDISSQAEHQVLLVGYKRIPKASAGESEELQTIPEGEFKVKATVTGMLNDIVKQVKSFHSDEKARHEVTLFAHNARYDFSLMKASLQKIQNIISKGVSTIYGVSFTHLGVFFTLKDSYKYMNWPLKDTAKKLGLDEKKYSKIEYAAYSFFNCENVRAGALPVPLEDYLACYNRENKSKLSATQFISNTDSRFWFVGANGVLMFWARNYYVYYLELDVEILLQGLLQMDKVLQQDLGAEIKGCVVPSLFSSFIFTIPGIAREFFTANGALDDSFQACGQLKEFAHESFYGGRVISNCTSSDTKVSYEDACSLYPSAMVEAIKELGGIVRGGCKLIEDHEKNMEFLSTVQYYLVRVKVTGMTKTQSCQVGVIPERRDNKVVYHWQWEGKEFTGVYGKIMLEDAIDILGLQYEILEGVYWNTPGPENNKYSTLTQQLYDTRVQYKKTKPALAEVIKLILNSGTYGCLARKPCYTKSVCVDMKKSRQYSANQFDDLDRWRPLSQHTMLFERNCVDENYTSVVTACIVLDMSKKIMNRVFTACSQVGVVIPYSDTDSFVIEQDKLAQMIKIYEETTGLQYQGNELGQFHSDFSIPAGAPKNTPQSDVVSTHFYNLGKKLYLHLTECANPNTGEVFKGYKMSCKGFTKTGLIHFAQQEFKQEDERRALQELFKAVDEGREYEINLFPTRESRIEFNTSLVASSVNNIEKPFIRTMKKTGNSEEEEEAEISILFV